ncbi:MAG: hypothetical protein ABSC56_04555 [Solirubrobacteraceae bacterium]|jgi:hypothetical protein
MQAEKSVLRILSSALDGATVRTPHTDGEADLVVETRDGQQIAIQARWAGEGWPDDVRRAARDLPQPWPANLVLLARRLSPGAIAWLRERDANWADEAGQARILGPGGLLVIRDPARQTTGSVSTRAFSWSPSALSIAEVILARADEPLRSAELARVSGWSTAQAAKVLVAFDAERWTIKRGPARGRHAYREIVDADTLLAAWSAALAAQPREVRVAHRAGGDAMTLLRGELSSALDREVTWAASGWAGLELAAPFATVTPSLHIYVADEDFAGPLSAAIKAGGLREVGDGGRVTFWRADRRTLGLASEHHGLPVVSAPRLYADLSSFDARGQDAADHVKAELIDPLHPASREMTPTAKPAEWE